MFELRGTKRFKLGDPLIDLLTCMRAGRVIDGKAWAAFRRTFAKDDAGTLDPRHHLAKFRDGYGMAMYWDTLARWIPQRARRDARGLGVPLVFLQAADECNTLDKEGAQRLLNVPNFHHTGHIHGVLPAHVGMRVRFAIKLNSTLGLVQEQKATIVGFLFEHSDQARYLACAPGEIFRPRFQPAGIWLQVDKFVESPTADEAMPFLGDPDGSPDDSDQRERARGLLFFKPVEVEFKWRSSETHTVRRIGFPLTHERFLTSTACQGQTIRTGVTIDCARIEPAGKQGASDEQWWLHLYVMLSRTTCMEDMLLLRPPP